MSLKDFNTTRGPLILLLSMSKPKDQHSRSYMYDNQKKEETRHYERNSNFKHPSKI